jgi:hypothetical protein
MNLHTGFSWDTVLHIILGEMPVEIFVAYFLLMCAGAFVFFVMDVRQSVKSNPATSTKFKLKFLVLDNILRGISVLFIIMAAVIWYDSFFGVPLNTKLAFMQGLSIDALIGTVLKEGKERGPLKKSREKLIRKYG